LACGDPESGGPGCGSDRRLLLYQDSGSHQSTLRGKEGHETSIKWAKALRIEVCEDEVEPHVRAECLDPSMGDSDPLSGVVEGEV
jgi:hypothetical protein